MRKKIVIEARSWINTAFHLHGRVKFVGCDCLGLVLGVASELNLHSKKGCVLPYYDTLEYDARQMKFPLECELRKHLIQSNSLQIGDIVLLSYESAPRHLGILGDYGTDGFSIIHSNMRLRKVVEHELSEEMKNRIVEIFSFIECKE